MTVAEEGTAVAVATMTAIALLAMTIADTDDAMTMGLGASIATPRAATIATAVVGKTDAADPTTDPTIMVVTVDVAMVTQLLRETHTVEVGATMTDLTIGTLVVRLRSANLLRYGAPLEVVRPRLTP